MKSNKQRKLIWIRAKNAMRKWPDCNYGEFYCNHIYDINCPWQWIDFRFFHSTSKKYYSVALTTLAYQEVEKFDYYDLPELNGLENNDRYAKIKELTLNNFEHPVKVTPYIELKDYGLPVIGMWASIDVPFIDEHVIRNFILFFRSLGEPTDAGFRWEGEEIEIDVRKII